LGKRFSQSFLTDPGVTIPLVCLFGELGVGKSVFVRGLLRGLGIKDRVLSPTFTLVKEYKLTGKRIFYHLDLYRLEKISQEDGLLVNDILADPHAVTAIEWADRLEVFPKMRFEIRFEYGVKPESRNLSIIKIIHNS
jgi:tRNA threonylcarbamoyladenosine biosynthesis protein TsaE